jgi:hypothetical protein
VNRSCRLYVALILCLATVACNERTVATTSISLTVGVPKSFNLGFVESVEVYLATADPSRPYSPDPSAPATASYEGIALEVEAKDFLPDDAGLRETRLRIAGNPFRSRSPDQSPSFRLVFESRSAGTNPIQINVRALKGTKVIASGTATRTIQDTPIVAVTDQKALVSLDLRCSPDFACDTGNQAPVPTPVGDVALAEGETRTVDLAATDPDGNAVAFSIAGAPPFVQLDARAGRLTIAPGFGDAGTYPGVQIRATDSGTPPLSTTETVTIRVTNTNRSPAFTSIGDLDPAGQLTFPLRENERFAIKLEAQDPDPTGNVLIYSATGLPPEAVLNSATGVLTWTPGFDTVTSQEGSKTFQVVFKATDSDEQLPLSATANATIVVQNVNRPPVFTQSGAPQNQAIAEGSALTFALAATDADGDPLTYAATWLETAPPSLPELSTALNATTGQFSWTPGYGDQRANPYKARFSVSDGYGGSAAKDITVQVANTNRLPVVTAIETSPVGSQRCSTQTGSLACALREGESFTLAIAVADDAEDAITSLTVSPAPVGSSLSLAPDRRSGLFSWTVGFDQGGATPTTLSFTAQDQNGGIGALAVPVAITDVNRPPSVTLVEAQGQTPKCGSSLPLGCAMSENDSLTLNVAVTDDAGEAISNLLMTAPPELAARISFAPTVDHRSAVFTFTPGYSDGSPSPYEFSFTAIDEKQGATTVKATVTVVNVNRLPTIAVAEVVPENGTARCGGGAGTSGSPILCSIPEDYPLQLSVTVTDPDADPISLLLMNAPSAIGAAFSPNVTNTAATFTWRPSYAQAGGPYPVTFSAEDAQRGTVQKSVAITVTDVNRPPRLTLAGGTVGSASVCRAPGPGQPAYHCYVDHKVGEDSTLLLRLAKDDPDGDPVTLGYASEDIPQAGTFFDPVRGIFAFVPQVSAPLSYSVTFSAVSRGYEQQPAQISVAIHTNFAGADPTVAVPGCGDSSPGNCPKTVPAGQALFCSVSVDDPDPRDRPLGLTASYLQGSSFSYDPVTQCGNITFVPPTSVSGVMQIDLDGTDTESRWTRSAYSFSVEAGNHFFPRAVPVAASGVSGVAIAGWYLYVGFTNVLQIYQVDPLNYTLSLVREILVPSRAGRAEPASGILVLRDPPGGVRIQDISANPATPALLRRYNVGPGRRISTTQLRANQSGQLLLYVLHSDTYLANDDRMDLVRLDRCSDGICPLRIGSVALGDGVTTIAAASDSLVVVRTSVPADGGLQQILKLVEVQPDATDGGWATLRVLDGASQSFALTGSVSSFGVQSLGPDAGVRIALPSSTTSLVLVDIDPSNKFGAPRPADGGPSSFSAQRVAPDLSYVVKSSPQSLQVFRDANPQAQFLGSVPLDGGVSVPNLIEVSGTVGIVASTTNLQVLNLQDRAAPTLGQQVSFSTDSPGRPSTYRSPQNQTFLYVGRRSTLPPFAARIEIYDVTDLSSTPRLGTLPSPASYKLPTRYSLAQGRYLALWDGHDTAQQIVGAKGLAVFDLGPSPVAPCYGTPPACELPTTGFEAPVYAGASPFPADILTVKGFTGTNGKEYLYVMGKLCVPSCSADGGTPPQVGTWLLELAPTGVSLAGGPSIDLGTLPDPAVAVGRPVPMAVQVSAQGSALYRTDVLGGGLAGVLAYDISDPLHPVIRGQVQLDMAPTLTTTLAWQDGTLLLTWGQRQDPTGGFVLLSAPAAQPFALQYVSQLKGIGSVVNGVLQSAGRAFIATNVPELLRLDLTNPLRPRVDGVGEISGAPPSTSLSNEYRLYLRDNRLLGGSNSAVEVFDLGP